MPQEVTCKIPFTTTGLAFAVAESYKTYSGYARKIPELCTIQQLYRYTLAQFEYQCSKLPTTSSCSTSSKYLDRVKAFPKNFSCIVYIIDSYGRFTEGECKFWTVAPPNEVHSPHTVLLTNLRAIVEELSTNGDKDFMQQNTLPGAIYDANGVLQNPDDIMPPEYNEASFQSDAEAAQLAFGTLYKYPGFISNCLFSDVGRASTLVSTALEKNGPYDSICPVKSAVSDDAAEGGQAEVTLIHKSRDWYTIHSLTDSADKPDVKKGMYTIHSLTDSADITDMEKGIMSYCGVWSERLETQWPDIKVRYPGSSKQLKFDVTWSIAFFDLHNRLRPEARIDDVIKEGMQWLTCRVPFTTTGLAFAVNNLYATYQNHPFSDYCTIHQLYRYTLVQFEFQCFVVSQAQQQACYYPYVDSFFFMYKKLDSSGVVKTYAENFKSIVIIIDSFGYFSRGKCKFGTVAPPVDVHDPHTIRISNLRAIVERLAAGGENDFVKENTLPGAVYNANGELLNANDIMPADYDEETFLSDARAFRRAYQTLRRDENWKNTIDRCSFSVNGKPSTLVSTSTEETQDSIPTIIADGREQALKKTKITNASVKQRQWYSIHPVNDTIMNYGILTYCGTWSESLEKKWSDMKVRNPGAAKQLKLETWFVDDKFLV